MITKTFNIDEANINKRLDSFLSDILDDISRGLVQQLIEQGNVLVNDIEVKKNYKLRLNDRIHVILKFPEVIEDEPQNIPLDIVFENEDFYIINKQAGLTVHPGAGQKDNTLLNGLLHLNQKACELPRCGIVHRLDKETSGLMVVAKNHNSQTILTNLIKDRAIERKYYALVHGNVISGGTIDEPIERHPKNRLIFTVDQEGKESKTHYLVKERYENFSLLDVKLETGRTHQIRVHLKHIGFPIAGDKQYTKISNWKGSSKKELNLINSLKGQFLHAYSLAFLFKKESFSFSAELPDYLTSVLKDL